MKTYADIIKQIEAGDYELDRILDGTVHYYTPNDEDDRVITVDHTHQQWLETDFWETDDFFENSDYNLTWDKATSAWIAAYEKY